MNDQKKSPIYLTKLWKNEWKDPKTGKTVTYLQGYLGDSLVQIWPIREEYRKNENSPGFQMKLIQNDRNKDQNSDTPKTQAPDDDFPF